MAQWVKNLPTNAEDTREVGLISGLGKAPGVGNGNPLHYSCLENSMDRTDWQDTVLVVTRVRHNWVTTKTGFQQESGHRCDGAKLRGNLRKLGKWFLKVKIICFIHFPYCISFFKNYIYNKGRMRERKKKKKGHDEGWVSKRKDDNNLQKNHWSQFRNWWFSLLFLSHI